MNYNKIAIVGARGSGKTTISDQLSKDLSLPVFHMDEITWDEDWVQYSEEVYTHKHASVVSKEKWIIEGYVNELTLDTIKKADVVIYLNYSKYISLFRLLKRYIRRFVSYYFKGLGCKPEESVVSLILYIFKNVFFSKESFYLNSILDKYARDKIVVLSYFDTAFRRNNKIRSRLVIG